MGKVVWTKTALDQLERIVKYISVERGNSYAKIVGTRIVERTEQLVDFPELGPTEPLLQHKKIRIQIPSGLELQNHLSTFERQYNNLTSLPHSTKPRQTKRNIIWRISNAHARSQLQLLSGHEMQA